MVFEWVLLAIGIVGFGAAAYWDLKTTEFPDWLPYSIIIAALVVRAIFAFSVGDLSIIIDSIVVGVAFLAFGYALYVLKQWGDGDAWLLGSLGFLFPSVIGFTQMFPSSFPFYADQIFNFFLVAFIYLIIYSLGMGLKNPKIWKSFKKDLRKDRTSIVGIIVVFSVLAISITFYLNYMIGIPFQNMYNIFLLPVLFAFLIIFIRYGKHIEQNLFRKEISVKNLRIGDVPMDEKWRVLDKKEIQMLKKKGGKIWIKEGVRLAPVFIISMLVSLFYGNVIYALFF
ncbi:MAG: A24 family peptidase [Candidatus Aenigmatarchaeota archaeon]|nr:A24 family peptidase [Nanoarchaeota archaeon]